MTGPQSLDDLFAAEEADRLAAARREIEQERAAWQALTPEQQAAHIAAVEAKYADLPDEGDEDVSDIGLEDVDEEYDDEQD